MQTINYGFEEREHSYGTRCAVFLILGFARNYIPPYMQYVYIYI